jgi:hypothetical protein
MFGFSSDLWHLRIFSVVFNGNNTINYFTNNCFQVLKQKLAIAIT